ncbi:MAG: GNAT family N-acetyltransferase [Hyphomonadaceae bacterium]|nr:GNAT family N-acetyltransferase [Hyphomonadaceae bacterium]
MSAPSIIVRPCFQQDLEAVQLIYAHHVLTGAGTFETEPPDLEEITARWSDVVSANAPYLVASPTRDLTRVLGFAYAKQFRPRAAYARTFENSIYVAPTSQRQGVGKLLMAHLLNTLKEDGVREVIAVIGDSANAGSIALHKSAGFTTIGVMTNVGYKFDRWLDVVIMQRSLRASA